MGLLFRRSPRCRAVAHIYLCGSLVLRCVLEPARQRGEVVGEIPWSVSRLFCVLARDRAVFGAPVQQDSTPVQQDGTLLVDEIILPLLRTHASDSNCQKINATPEKGRIS